MTQRNVWRIPSRSRTSMPIRCGLWRILRKQGGIAFLIIYYTARNILYYMRFQEVQAFWKRAEEGWPGKSFRFEELDPRFFLELQGGIYVPYLDAINQDLSLREELDKE